MLDGVQTAPSGSRLGLNDVAACGLDEDAVRGLDEFVAHGLDDVAVRGLNETASDPRPPGSGRSLQVRDLGLVGYAEAFELQQSFVEKRKRGEIHDQLLFVEHPPVVTLGRNAHEENVLASEELLERAGIGLHRTDRGGDVTFHGPGQIVGYPVLDLREWKRDVVAYVRAIEEVLIGALAEFSLRARRLDGATGVWVSMPGGLAKIAAIGVHVSRWVTSHGFALNVSTDLSYFRYIVPCGLTQPVTSMREAGADAPREDVQAALARSFARVFERELDFSTEKL